MDLLEQLLTHLIAEMQSIRYLDALLKFSGSLGITVDLLHDLLIEELEHDRYHEDSRRLCLLKVLLDISESFTDGNCRSSVDLTQEAACALICVMQRQY